MCGTQEDAHRAHSTFVACILRAFRVWLVVLRWEFHVDRLWYDDLFTAQQTPPHDAHSNTHAHTFALMIYVRLELHIEPAARRINTKPQELQSFPPFDMFVGVLAHLNWNKFVSRPSLCRAILNSHHMFVMLWCVVGTKCPTKYLCVYNALAFVSSKFHKSNMSARREHLGANTLLRLTHKY